MNERFILGCKVNDIDLVQAVKRLQELVRLPKTAYVVTPNPEICLAAQKNDKLREIIRDSDLSLPDGFGLKIGARIIGSQLHNRIAGVDLSYEVFKFAEQNGNTILLIGGKGKSGTKAIENLKELHPKLHVFYLNGGKFDEEGNSEFPDFIEKINTLAPDIILVNLGVPKQELFMFSNRNKLKTKLMLGVGGTIDFLAGNLRRAPNWMRSLGLEWLFRLFQEPWRWKRIINAVILFPLSAIGWRLRTMYFYRKNVVGLIINNDKNLLLAKRQVRAGDQTLVDHWQLPQGGVEAGEDMEQAVLREMGEEIGLTDLKVIDKKLNCYKYNWPLFARTIFPGKGQKQSVYLLKYEGDPKAVHLDQKEFVDYRWLDKNQIMSLAHPLRRPIIKIALDSFAKYL